MTKGLLQHIAERLKSYPANVFLVENNDRFLYRSDVQDAFETIGIFKPKPAKSLAATAHDKTDRKTD